MISSPKNKLGCLHNKNITSNLFSVFSIKQSVNEQIICFKSEKQNNVRIGTLLNSPFKMAQTLCNKILPV